LLLAVTVLTLVLVDVVGGIRIARGGLSDELPGLVAINVGYLVGVALGAFLRMRE
jgi:hypothetical protein